MKGLLGGLSYDGRGRLLATYNEASKKKTTSSTSSRCGVWVIDYATGQVLFNFDSTAADLRRPGRICCITVNQEEFKFHTKDNNREEEEEEEEEGEEREKREKEEQIDEQVADALQPYHAGYIYVTDLGDDSVKQYRYL